MRAAIGLYIWTRVKELRKEQTEYIFLFVGDKSVSKNII